ncbi:alpha-methylacyl-CoA racemase-like protein [Microthyrium microscopicum]|uniref:Alpha-methylacyl-CoA racemase-like protein n=1 Tax=Microthyrium microscopicum TaxID=703497 RepID=A0A6A6UM68_9PEZI|nr:alpha-methylacyl-CoA racemase-like protein [Microthyrium microscopicum]
MTSPPPLNGIRVLEFAGLAPGPFAGMLLADYGATVLRLDRAVKTNSPLPPTPDQLVRRKTSITVDLKAPGGVALIKSLLPHVDVIIDPFRPGVLEKIGLCPSTVMLSINPRLVIGRMTGFRRDGKYSMMAGHDINYIAVSGVLSMLGRQGEKPYAPGNIIGDFAGGGAVCFMGILLALMARQHSGRGQVVEANMVDGSATLASMPRLATKRPVWAGERGTNMLDGGCPYYDTYETKDGKYMAVGALEPQFFAALLKGLGLTEKDLPARREDISKWAELRTLFTKTFKGKTRKEWEDTFDGTDACCTPVLENGELEENGFDQRPIVTLRETPGFAIADGSWKENDIGIQAAKGQGHGVKGQGWDEKGLVPAMGGEETLARWVGWKRGKQFEQIDGGLSLKESSRL